MTLDQWLTEQKINSEEFGRRIGSTGEAVRKWRAGERMPEPEMVETIRIATKDSVTVSDLHLARLSALRTKGVAAA